MKSADFPWDALKLIFGGNSIIDIPALNLKTGAEAYQFLATYGYDLYEETQAEQVRQIYRRACKFIRERLLPSTLEMPGIFLSEQAPSITNLLMAASGVDLSTKFSIPQFQEWACAILRVMHAISHLQNDLRLRYLPTIKRHTIDRFEAHVQVLQEGTFLGFERERIPLAGFQKKESKIRESIILKLLHRTAQVAQEVHDHIGVRFVTHSRADAVLVVKYLIDHHLISIPKLMPSRCRNSLLDLDSFREEFEKTKFEEWEDFAKFSEKVWEYPSVDHEANRFSADSYHALQFTTRHLIRIPTIRKGGIRSENAFFFPLEVQVLDKRSFEASQSGEAEHSQYKQKQLEAVRRRVLRGLVSHES